MIAVGWIQRFPSLLITIVMIRFALLFLILAFAARAADQTLRPSRNEDSRVLIQMISRPYEDLPADLREEGDAWGTICQILLQRIRVQRKEIGPIVTAYAQSKDARTRRYLVACVLYHIQDPTIARLFRSHLSEEESEESYYLANYVAKLGDEKALAILNRHFYQYPVSSWQWSYSVELFGEFGYRPAIPNLISSLDASSLNVVYAAVDSLNALYPETPKDFKTRAEFREYFLKRAQAEKTTPR